VKREQNSSCAVGRAVMRDARPWLFIFAVLSAVLQSCGHVLGTPLIGWCLLSRVLWSKQLFWVMIRVGLGFVLQLGLG